MGIINKLNGYNILSISSAPGWRAMVATDDFQDYISVVLVCWALVQKGEHQQIVGVIPLDEMCGEFNVVDFDPYFIGFVHNDEESLPLSEIQSRLETAKEIAEEMRREESLERESC